MRLMLNVCLPSMEYVPSLMYWIFHYIPHHPFYTYRYMNKYHSGKSWDYGQAWLFKCFDHLEKLLCWMFHKISFPNKDKILWIRKNNYIIFWLRNVYYYNILSGKNKYYAEEIYIHIMCIQCTFKLMSFILTIDIDWQN